MEFKQDKWIIEANNPGQYNYHFSFDFLPNEWFKTHVKLTTRESIELGKLSISTLHTYNYRLKNFFEFVNELEIDLQYFSDLNHSIIEQYIFFLLNKYKNSSSRSSAFSSLKHHILHGQFMEWEGFPLDSLYDGTELRMLQSEDTLKTMVLDDTSLKNIDNALKQYKKIVLIIMTLLCGHSLLLSDTLVSG